MPKENNMSKKDEAKKKELSDKIVEATKLSQLQGKNMTEFKKFGLENEAKTKIEELRNKKNQLKEEADSALEKAEAVGGTGAKQELEEKIEPISKEAEETVAAAENEIHAVVAEVESTEKPVVVPVVEKKSTPKTKAKKEDKSKTNKKENNTYKPQTPEERIEKIKKEGSEEAKKVIAEWEAEKSKDVLTGKLTQILISLGGKAQKEYARNFSFDKEENIHFDSKGIKISIQKALESIGLPVKSIEVPQDDFVATITLDDGTVMEFGDISEDDELEPKPLNVLAGEIINHYIDTDINVLMKKLRIVGAIDARYAKKLGDLEDAGNLYAKKSGEPKKENKEPVKKTEPVAEKKNQKEPVSAATQALLESFPEYTELIAFYNDPANNSPQFRAEKKKLLEEPMIYFLEQMVKKDATGKKHFHSAEKRSRFQKIYGEIARLKTEELKVATPVVEPVVIASVEVKKEDKEAVEKLHEEIQGLFANEIFAVSVSDGKTLSPEVQAKLASMGGVAPEEKEAPAPVLFIDNENTAENVSENVAGYVPGTQVSVRMPNGTIESDWKIGEGVRMSGGKKIFTIYKGESPSKAGTIWDEASEEELDKLNNPEKAATAASSAAVESLDDSSDDSNTESGDEEPEPIIYTGRTVESLGLIESEKTTLREILSKFSMTLEEVVGSIEGFAGLSYGQQRMVLENLGQITLGRIEDRGLEYQQLDARYSKWNKKIWKTLSQKYQIVTKTKETADHIMAGGLEIHGELLRQLVKGMETTDVGVYVEKNKKGVERLEVTYTNFNMPALDERERNIVYEFNEEASAFAAMPSEWAFATASAGEQKKYKEQQAKFERALGNIVLLKRKELGNDPSVEPQAVRFGIEIRNKVLLNQFLTSHPDFEERLSELKDPGVLAKLGDIASLDKGISLGLGFAVRSFAGVALGASGLPVAIAAGAISGTVGGIRRHNRDVTAKEKAARRSDLEEARGIKKSLNRKDFKDLSVREAALAMSLDARSQTERLSSLVKKIKDLDAKYSLNHVSEKKYHKEKFLLMQSLRRRESYVGAKLVDGSINFGSDGDRVVNHLAFMSALNEAQVYIALNEKNPADDILLEIYTDKENRFDKKKEMLIDEIKSNTEAIEVLETRVSLSKDDKKVLEGLKKRNIELTAEKDGIILPNLGQRIKKGFRNLFKAPREFFNGKDIEITPSVIELTEEDKINLAKNPSQRAELLNKIQKRNNDAYQSVKNKAWRSEVGKAALMGAGFGALGYGARHLGALWDSGKEYFDHTVDTIKHFGSMWPDDDTVVPVPENIPQEGTVPVEVKPETPVQTKPVEPIIIDENSKNTTPADAKPAEVDNSTKTDPVNKGTTPEKTPVEAEQTVPELTDEAKIGKGEGIESAFRRQIEANEAIAEKLGWDGTQDLHEFSGGAAHRLAEDLGYVSSEGEVRVGTEGVGYQLSIDGDEVGVSEYDADGNFVESRTGADDFEGDDTNSYEYKEDASSEAESETETTAETEKTAETTTTTDPTKEAVPPVNKDLNVEKRFTFDKSLYRGTADFTYDESGNVLNVVTNPTTPIDPEKYLNETWPDLFGYVAPGAESPVDEMFARAQTLAAQEDLLRSLDPVKYPDEVAFLKESIGTLSKAIEADYGDVINDSVIAQTKEAVVATVPETVPAVELPAAEALTPEQIFEQKVTDSMNMLLSRFFVEEGVLLTEAKYGPETSLWQELSTMNAETFLADSKAGMIDPSYVEFAESLERLSADTGIELAPTKDQTVGSLLHDFIAQSLEGKK